MRKEVLRAAYALAQEGAFGALPPGKSPLLAFPPPSVLTGGHDADRSAPHIPIHEGTYAYVSGPTYETPAEGRLLRAQGCDVVGMSTVPEVLAAREEGVEVVVLSLVTNKVVVGAKEDGWVRGEVVDEVRFVDFSWVFFLGRG